MKIQEIMTQKVIKVTNDTPIAEVAELLFDKNLTGMPVVDDKNHVIGIVTEYDLLSRHEHIHIPSYTKLLSRFKSAGNKSMVKREIEKVQSLLSHDIMTYPVVTISPKADVSEAARIFSVKRINPLPVVDQEGKLVGIVSRADIVKLFRALKT